MINAFEKVKAMVVSAEADAHKFYNRGNQSAGVRLRRAFQEIKKVAHEGRAEVTKLKKKY